MISELNKERESRAKDKSACKEEENNKKINQKRLHEDEVNDYGNDEEVPNKTSKAIKGNSYSSSSLSS